MNGLERIEQAARARIRERLDETLFVEAGAGTGKTRALVERAVSLVLAGTPVDRIVAITFTEKAAAELRERIRLGLEQAEVSDPAHAERVSRALESLDRAEVSTIHAFCHGLLRSFAAEAGVDPAFTVADEVTAERRFQERWRLYLEGLAGNRDAEEAIDRVLRLGMTTADIEKLVRALRDRLEFVPVIERLVQTGDDPPWPDIAGLRRRVASVSRNLVPAGDSLRRHFENLERLLERLARAAGNQDAILAAHSHVLTQSVDRTGRRENWGSKEAIAYARAVASEVAEPLAWTLSRLRAEALAELMPFVVRFLREDADARAREGTMEFDDLVRRVRDLLTANVDARRALRRRYDVMLIDEFQDTDPLQVDIALAFATDPDTGALDSGRLFLVGDPKQSIYRFRRADMAVYARTRATIEQKGGAFPELVVNRRCRKPIVDWVNSVFSALIGDGGEPHVQPPYRPIGHARDVALDGPGVGWFGGPVDARAPEVRRREAEAVASWCWHAVNEQWKVADRDQAPRPAQFRDIAILIPARTSLAALERALQRAGIPYRVEGGSLVYRTQEVRDLINCLTAIDDPADEVAIVGALRSPAFACSDFDIARHYAGGGRFDYLRPDLDARAGPVADALRTLRDYHHLRHDMSLAALVDRFVRDRGLAEVGILDRGDRNSFRRARFVAEQARAFESGGPQSLRAFIMWLERRASQVMLDHEGAGIDDDEDAVRILTIHGAKGLEFPIVILAGLGAGPSPDTTALVVDRASERFHIRLGSSARRFELGEPDIREVESRHEEAERARLLYVAATRARDHLLISLYHPDRRSAAPTLARRLIEAGACEFAAELPEPSRSDAPPPAPFAGVRVDLPEGTDGESFRERRRELVTSAMRRRYTSATALGRMHAEAPDEEHPVDEDEPWARGKGSTHLGRAVHATLQSVGLDADESAIDAFARAQAVAEAIPGRADEVASLVRRALGTDAARRARAAPRAFREVPFVVDLDGVVLEGFVDLVIETADGIEIVDWKTDSVTAGQVDERLQSYALQAGLYVLGIEAATGRPVRAVTYVFVQPGVERSPGEPPALAAMARNALKTPASAS
ncbi:MAG TPA: UvrD-helicase domain-containing protein [Dehalococcoidia bacterium]|jgi:ATP-dependent helicase/nuclease subunit A|nr:UvrD-helicase domain-containing protein [Dehalococcoidia bacterium]